MKIIKDLSKQYNLLKDTLKLAGSYSENISDEEIEKRLEELEGDYYTFFHKTHLTILNQSNYLPEIHVENILTLRSKIDAIPPNLWNKREFKTNNLWQEVHKLADTILVSL